jgi:acetylornithine deacetylase/succinyl-diaminopimelate desuccinylase-like protein
VSIGERSVALLRQLIGFNTVNPPGNERPAQEFLRDQLERAGFECELIGASPDRPNLIARLRGDTQGRRLCLLGHVDTVLADRRDWSVDPWAAELRDGYVWGRGALDMKGQVACEVAASLALAESGWRPAAGELLVVTTCDEEAGGALGARWLCENVPNKVRCDLIVNEGAGEVVEFGDRRYYTICIGEKGVFAFDLATRGRAGHSSMPNIASNALLRMIGVLARLGDRQPAFDRYNAGDACLEALVGDDWQTVEQALDRVRSVEPRLADQLDPMLRVTLAPTMIRASEKENVIPSRCRVRMDCRVPPGLGREHVLRRVEELLGPAAESGYDLDFKEEIVGNQSPLDGVLAAAIKEFVVRRDPGAALLPIVLPGFTDSNWFRRAFPEVVAIGFFPQRAMSRFDTAPLIHGADERIDVTDLELASSFFDEIVQEVLG